MLDLSPRVFSARTIERFVTFDVLLRLLLDHDLKFAKIVYAMDLDVVYLWRCNGKRMLILPTGKGHRMTCRVEFKRRISPRGVGGWGRSRVQV